MDGIPSAADRLEFLRRMVLARCVDNELKRLFLSSEVLFEGKGFQGKGFRSLGQEAICAAAWALKYGESYVDSDGYSGDIVAPLIRDLALVLAFIGDDPLPPLNGQIGKDTMPSFGKDLNQGDLSRGVFPPGAPLAMPTNALIGMAWAMKQKREDRICVSLSGDGATSLGEWHEAINVAAVQKLPMIFCIQDNQTALSVPRHQQSAVGRFAQKAAGYGMDSVTVDGNDPDAISKAFVWGRDKAISAGPVLIELLTMRMCGHAHHDDMLYLGYDPKPAMAYPPLKAGGYANKALYQEFQQKDPIFSYHHRLVGEGICQEGDLSTFIEASAQKVAQAKDKIVKMPWPVACKKSRAVYINGPEPSQNPAYPPTGSISSTLVPMEREGSTYLEAIAKAVGDAMKQDSGVYMFGEDVGAPYGNAFMMFRGVMEGLEDRFVNTPISESAIVGLALGSSLEGFKPIAEMQFNDFVACGFNQIVNGIAKFFYRNGVNLPLVIRMPWGGLRHAGPYHSQDTSPWFYRTPGLKIVAPSTPLDAYGLMRAAIDDPDPVMFYEHINLYRDPKIKQIISNVIPEVQIGEAKMVHRGNGITIITYGAYVHRILKIVLKDQLDVELIDLRTLQPLDWNCIEGSIRKTSRVLLAGEDTKTGSILESVASQISDRLFDCLDAPVRVLGALDTPVPYSPSLEADYLLSSKAIRQTISDLMNW